MKLTREMVMATRKEIEAQKDRLIADLNAHDGALQLCDRFLDRFLAELDRPEPADAANG